MASGHPLAAAGSPGSPTRTATRCPSRSSSCSGRFRGRNHARDCGNEQVPRDGRCCDPPGDRHLLPGYGKSPLGRFPGPGTRENIDASVHSGYVTVPAARPRVTLGCRGSSPAEEVRMPDAVSDPKGPTSDPKDVVRRFFATLGTGDFAAIGEFFTDDSVWMVNDVARGLPSQHGRRAIIDDFLQPVREGLFEPGDPKVEIRSMIGEGDRVAAETTARGMLRNGNHYENHYVFIAQVDGDKVTFLREYMDTAYAHDISAGSGSADGDADDHVAEQLRRLGHD